MTTKAQIEAAAKAVHEVLTDRGDLATWEEVAKAALTAAAQVGKEVGDVIDGPSRARLKEAYMQGVKDTIERCAQVADDMQLYTAWDIAAAIRAMIKDPNG